MSARGHDKTRASDGRTRPRRPTCRGRGRLLATLLAVIIAGPTLGCGLHGDARVARADEGDTTTAANAGEWFTGRASYYSDSLAGRSTASGEPYDPGELTAAHRSLPFGTVVEVERVDTGARVTVRVNDRGPFNDRRRIFDLSRRAAEELDMIRRGVVEIRARVIGEPGE